MLMIALEDRGGARLRSASATNLASNWATVAGAASESLHQGTWTAPRAATESNLGANVAIVLRVDWEDAAVSVWHAMLVVRGTSNSKHGRAHMLRFGTVHTLHTCGGCHRATHSPQLSALLAEYVFDIIYL